MLLESGMNITLRPMQYPVFYEMYKNGIRNTWTVDEVDLSDDIKDMSSSRLTDPERHLVNRLVAFFATGDSIVANNLVLNLYKHINSPEARLYLSRQLFEEAQHVQFYLTLLDTYIPDHDDRHEMFRAIETIPSVKKKADFGLKWIDSIHDLDTLDTREKKRQFLLNLICFASCVEGIFFYAAFAYVYFMRNKGLLNGLASGTNWIFRDESMHMSFAFEVINQVRSEYPDLFDEGMQIQVANMIEEAVDCETQFAEDLLHGGVAGLTTPAVRQYLEYVADQRMENLSMPKIYGSRNPFAFMELQDVQELSNFFERRVSAYQSSVEGSVSFDSDF